jgi:hypothetical protein
MPRAGFLAGISDYRAFSNQEGFVHAVAHGADLALQLALNPAVAKPQLDTLLTAISGQIAPGDPSVAYWAGSRIDLRAPSCSSRNARSTLMRTGKPGFKR